MTENKPAERKALKNIPMPDEEKLRALYRPPSETAQPHPADPRESSTQDYIPTSNQDYKQTSNQGYQLTSTQASLPASQHVYTHPSTPPAQHTQARAVPQTYMESYHPAPPGQPRPQPPPTTEVYREAPQPRRLQHLADLYRRQTYHLRPDQIDKIRTEAFHTRRKISEVLRDIIDRHYTSQREY